MGMFAETEIVDYRLLFAGQNKLPFSISVSTKQTEDVAFHLFCFPYIYIYYLYIDICCHFKWKKWKTEFIHLHLLIMEFRWFKNQIKQKTEVQAIFLNPFTICSSCTRKFVVCPFADKETGGSYLFANGLKGLNELNRLISVYIYSSLDIHDDLIVTFKGQ